MAIHELQDLKMTESGESIDFVHGVLLESEMEDNVLYDLTLKNVIQYKLFYDNMQKKEPVQVTFTTINGQTAQSKMEVRAVNRRDADDNVIELSTRDKIEFS